MKPKHETLLDVVSEWYGLGEFQDQYGGIQDRINRYNSTSKWRKKCAIHKMHFSRTQKTVKTIADFAEKEGTSVEEACMALQSQ